jgi:hypothetical protein
MARYERFTFLCDITERRLLASLAEHLERSQSDAVRLLIREAARGLATDGDKRESGRPTPQRAEVRPC